ncbi:ABC transporter substrate-binding protein [Amycolatopsis sp. NPDC006131]|uniref:ABC transporter substrate-binding protein n=1 Tax=Amycolatopsis sp. NPDC006131 TaxID=3156731 RepID=UPI0033A254C5
MRSARSWRRSLAAAATTVALLAATACGSQSAGRGGDAPLRILYVSGITGLLAPASKAVQRGMTAAIESVNASGGVRGRKLELTIEDNQSDATRGLTLIQQALTGDQPPDLIVPGVSSSECLAVAPLLTRQKQVGIGVSSTSELNDPQRFPYYFSQAASQKAPLEAVAAHVKDAGGRTLALVVPNDGLGESISDNLDATLGQAGITYSVERFAADGVDYSAAFAAAVSKNPDFIFADASAAQVPYLLESRIKAGAGRIPLIGGTSIAVQPVLDLAKGTDQLQNFQLVLGPGSVHKPPAEASEAFKEFYDKVSAQGGLEVPLNTYGYGWDVIQTFAAAARATDGELTQEALKDALEHLGQVPQLVGFTRLYSTTTHQVSPAAGDITIATPVEKNGGQYVVK